MTRDPGLLKLAYGSVILLVVAGATIVWLILEMRSPPSDQVAGMPAEQFEGRVREYLHSNPEVIVEALQRLETRKRSAAQDRLKAVLSDKAEDILRDPDSPVSGNPEGDVTLVEFADYNCPYCRRVAPLVTAVESSDSRLRIVYKEIPILGPDSVFAAKAALAAHRQGKYVAFHRALMDAKGVAAEGLVLAIAARVGLDVERLRTDMESPSIQVAIDKNLALARTLGINGTPAFIVGDEVVSGAIDKSAMRQLIGRARAAAR